MTAPHTLPAHGTPAYPGMDAALAAHPAYARVFRPGQLTFGLIAPLEAYPDSAVPPLRQHLQLVQHAEALGFSAIWLRDVPFHDPDFGDVAQVHDPMVYAGWLAAHTQRIAIGTAGIILALRNPLLVAKQACSVDQLLQGRFLLGLSTGDRPSEYPAFGVDYQQRAERYRDAYQMLQSVVSQDYPVHYSHFHGTLDGTLDLVPKPVTGRLPTLAVGRCGQELSWLAQHTDGWIWHQSDAQALPWVLEQWRACQEPGQFKPYGYGAFFDLEQDPGAPLRAGRGLRGGRQALLDLWLRQREQGVSHIALNLRISRRPVQAVLDELAEHVLPQFA
ncbi:LLM class oxidoreductase [Mitsuaria sp. RG]|nr:LLM class oxidoreductase [Mitsuaria sp. RG]BCJ07702.1 luciferase [Pseudomonas sp. RtIB026]